PIRGQGRGGGRVGGPARGSPVARCRGRAARAATLGRYGQPHHWARRTYRKPSSRYLDIKRSWKGGTVAETWNPEQYEKFSDQRRRPFADLTARVGARSPKIVVDLGCGSGAPTLALGARWPRARIIGVDSSDEMLDQARLN